MACYILLGVWQYHYSVLSVADDINCVSNTCSDIAFGVLCFAGVPSLSSFCSSLQIYIPLSGAVKDV